MTLKGGRKKSTLDKNNKRNEIGSEKVYKTELSRI